MAQFLDSISGSNKNVGIFGEHSLEHDAPGFSNDGVRRVRKFRRLYQSQSDQTREAFCARSFLPPNDRHFSAVDMLEQDIAHRGGHEIWHNLHPRCQSYPQATLTLTLWIGKGYSQPGQFSLRSDSVSGGGEADPHGLVTGTQGIRGPRPRELRRTSAGSIPDGLQRNSGEVGVAPDPLTA